MAKSVTATIAKSPARPRPAGRETVAQKRRRLAVMMHEIRTDLDALSLNAKELLRRLS